MGQYLSGGSEEEREAARREQKRRERTELLMGKPGTLKWCVVWRGSRSERR